MEDELDEAGGVNNNNNNNNQHELFDAQEATELLCNGARIRDDDGRTYRVIQSFGKEEYSMVEVQQMGVHQPELITRQKAVYFRKQYIN
jgi:hypothetical protein